MLNKKIIIVNFKLILTTILSIKKLFYLSHILNSSQIFINSSLNFTPFSYSTQYNFLDTLSQINSLFSSSKSD